MIQELETKSISENYSCCNRVKLLEFIWYKTKTVEINSYISFVFWSFPASNPLSSSLFFFCCCHMFPPELIYCKIEFALTSAVCLTCIMNVWNVKFFFRFLGEGGYMIYMHHYCALLCWAAMNLYNRINSIPNVLHVMFHMMMLLIRSNNNKITATIKEWNKMRWFGFEGCWDEGN